MGDVREIRRKRREPPRKTLAPKIVEALHDGKVRMRLAEEVVERCRHFHTRGDRVGVWKGIVAKLRDQGIAEGADAVLLADGLTYLSRDVREVNEARDLLVADAVAIPFDLTGADPRIPVG